ncbi:hypothetical protein D8674_014901 [Pyrus ussuriensis x Pyrus communis]|uniref:Uncharacterized protein n=1 Tax=Pyrus ussuriensis x Pyrus communis TaxID=2448454 RepID=A0A5N5GZ19_9ROSA|nr:hypothetical protein D8674_014901 [Pyrus ussuriensis x Pyrus communis]
MAQMSRLNQLGRVMKRRRRVKSASFALLGMHGTEPASIQTISDTAVEFNPFVFAAFGVFRYVCCLSSVTVPFSAFALSDTCVPSVQSVVLVYQVAFGSVEGVKVLADNVRGR